MRRVRTTTASLALASALLMGLAPVASAVEQSDIEDEVMCPICGTLLELSQSPQAEREKIFIKELIAKGESKQEIKDALVAEYGQDVLATPGDSGFGLSAYLVPIVAFIVAAIALSAAAIRWRGKRDMSDGPVAAAPGAEDSARLERDLGRYDL